jgi:hypothetical protein
MERGGFSCPLGSLRAAEGGKNGVIVATLNEHDLDAELLGVVEVSGLFEPSKQDDHAGFMHLLG